MCVSNFQTEGAIDREWPGRHNCILAACVGGDGSVQIQNMRQKTPRESRLYLFEHFAVSTWVCWVTHISDDFFCLVNRCFWESCNMCLFGGSQWCHSDCEGGLFVIDCVLSPYHQHFAFRLFITRDHLIRLDHCWSPTWAAWSTVINTVFDENQRYPPRAEFVYRWGSPLPRSPQKGRYNRTFDLALNWCPTHPDGDEYRPRCFAGHAKVHMGVARAFDNVQNLVCTILDVSHRLVLEIALCNKAIDLWRASLLRSLAYAEVRNTAEDAA